MLWPATADLCDFKTNFQYSLPADIMRVDFSHETWVYRLFEDGSIKKLVQKRVVMEEIFAVNNELPHNSAPAAGLVSG
jgi:hypothetical protein